MWMLPKLLILLKLFAWAYVLFVLVMAFLAILTAPKKILPLLIFMASVAPLLLIWSLLAVILPAGRRRIPVYDEESAAIEDKIEAKRVAIFGGRAMNPSVSAIWQSVHNKSLQAAQVTLEKTVTHAKKIFVGKIVTHHS